MININFGGIPGMNFEMMSLTMELTLGNAVVETQQLQGPYQMVVMQCQEIVNQIAQDQRPMKVEFKGTKCLELPNGDTVDKPSKLIYANNAYTNSFGDLDKESNANI